LVLRLDSKVLKVLANLAFADSMLERVKVGMEKNRDKKVA